MILAGDIGGTKTILALVSAEIGPRAPVVETRFPSANYQSLTDIVMEFVAANAMQLTQNPITAAAFGIAGPIIGTSAEVTNLGWYVEQAELAAAIGIPPEHVRLLNDLEATATAVPRLLPVDLHTLNASRPIPYASIAIIAPGTGLGEAYLTWDGQQYRAHPSEGGHADFAPGDRLQLALVNYLSHQYDHVSTERVCSGLGIPNIYNFLRDEKYAVEPDWLHEALAEAPDPVPIIMSNAADPEDATDICRRTLETFVSILGAEAGDLALILLARGGVFLGGGIPPRILPHLDGPHFREAFIRKGRFADLMEQIPVHVILNPKTALLGTAYAALDITTA
ncbi:MAG: glucokinase [Anaerolineae bacterium]|nr:glucokinase [Anaerolineae bacterium]